MKPNPESPLRSLMETFPRAGRLEWIGLRRQSHGDVVSVGRETAVAGAGLAGDHRSGRPGSRRQVTLIQQEHLAVVAGLMAMSTVDPRLLRRNLVVSGINLLALKDQRFSIGGAVFEYTGLCEPCSRMERQLGCGGYNAMRGHGGITAIIVAGGEIAVGDAVAVDNAVDGNAVGGNAVGGRPPQSGSLF